MNCISESSGRRLHQYSCGCESDDISPEVDTQWVKAPNQPFQLSFNASLKIDFQGSRVTSDGGLILVRELDERLGFGELIQQHLPVAADGSAAADSELVPDQPAAAAGEDPRPTGEARATLLAPARREPPDAATIRGHDPADRVTALAGRLDEPLTGGIERGLRRRREKCPRNRSKEGRFRALGRSRGAKADLSDGPSRSGPAGGCVSGSPVVRCRSARSL